MSGFGNLVAYEQRAPRTNEVYCVELVISNPGTLVVGPDGKLTPTFTRTDMLEVFGRLVAENTYKYYDVRAVCVDAFPAETGFTVWVVVTSNDPTVVIESWRQDPEELRNRINLDTRFTSRFPAGRVSALQWLQIVPPPAGIVEEWLGFPIIWDKRLSPPKGAPTAEWASGDDSVWTGKPDWQTGIGGGDLKKTRWKPTVVPPVGPGIPGPSPADIATGKTGSTRW